MKYAYTQDNTVAQVLRVPPTNIYAPEFAAQFVECPDEVEVGWLWDGGVFSAPALDPLIERQAAAWERIKAERDRRKFAGVKVGTDWFHCDTDSRGQWERMVNRVNTQGLVDSAGYTIGGQPVPWKTMTGSFVILTAGKIRAVVDAVELQEAMIFGRAEMHRLAMEASSTPESYDFSGGWPVSIEDAP